ncbi:spidroin-1-like, partial [Mesocricetus auratus]|uniref:Spidroin-1-like n=1 Tax=Mesocricetus auratus TaxID=10036 RepID=A0ABM2X634_MESAU
DHEEAAAATVALVKVTSRDCGGERGGERSGWRGGVGRGPGLGQLQRVGGGDGEKGAGAGGGARGRRGPGSGALALCVGLGRPQGPGEGARTRVRGSGGERAQVWRPGAAVGRGCEGSLGKSTGAVGGAEDPLLVRKRGCRRTSQDETNTWDCYGAKNLWLDRPYAPDLFCDVYCVDFFRLTRHPHLLTAFIKYVMNCVSLLTAPGHNLATSLAYSKIARRGSLSYHPKTLS